MSDRVGTTRVSLLARVKDLRSQESWKEFVDLYGPLISRFLRKLGVVEADTADLTQEVFAIVVRRLPSFKYDPAKGRFRGWLKTVTIRRALRFFAQQRRTPLSPGGTAVLEVFLQQPDPHDQLEEMWEQEWRQRVLEAAMDQVRRQVSQPIWRTFQMTVLHGSPAQQVAEGLGMSVGQVYVNKCRVLKRLRQVVEDTDEFGTNGPKAHLPNE